MNQDIQPLFEVGAMKVAAGNTPDPEVAALAQAAAVLCGVQAPPRARGQRLPSAGEVGALLRREGLYWTSPRSADDLRLGIQAVHCGGCGFGVEHILLS
ncbi:MAG: hypothetical protein M3461_03050 [Pseudomonadota bacterium]|nr:hypothetical protein [Pseudomonadota bacterium]